MLKSMGLAAVMGLLAIAWMLYGPDADTSMSKSIRIRITEGDAERLKKLLETTVEFPERGIIDFVSGGELRVGENEVIKIGSRISGVVKELDADTLSAALKISLSNPVISENATTQVVRFEILEIRTKLTRSVESRIHCGGQRWCELLVSDAAIHDDVK